MHQPNLKLMHAAALKKMVEYLVTKNEILEKTTEEALRASRASQIAFIEAQQHHFEEADRRAFRKDWELYDCTYEYPDDKEKGYENREKAKQRIMDRKIRWFVKLQGIFKRKRGSE